MKNQPELMPDSLLDLPQQKQRLLLQFTDINADSYIILPK